MLWKSNTEDLITGQRKHQLNPNKKSHKKKTGFRTLSGKHIFGKTTGGGSNLPTPQFLRVKDMKWKNIFIKNETLDIDLECFT